MGLKERREAKEKLIEGASQILENTKTETSAARAHKQETAVDGVRAILNKYKPGMMLAEFSEKKVDLDSLCVWLVENEEYDSNMPEIVFTYYDGYRHYLIHTDYVEKLPDDEAALKHRLPQALKELGFNNVEGSLKYSKMLKPYHGQTGLKLIIGPTIFDESHPLARIFIAHGIPTRQKKKEKITLREVMEMSRACKTVTDERYFDERTDKSHEEEMALDAYSEEKMKILEAFDSKLEEMLAEEPVEEVSDKTCLANEMKKIKESDGENLKTSKGKKLKVKKAKVEFLKEEVVEEVDDILKL